MIVDEIIMQAIAACILSQKQISIFIIRRSLNILDKKHHFIFFEF